MLSSTAVIRCSMVSGLFGLPDWWCIVSLGLISLLLLLFIIAYFKGRSLYKRSIRTTGIKAIACSNCGHIMTRRLDECPRCRSIFEEDVYRCPKCNDVVARADRSCPKCKVPFRDVDPPDERSTERKKTTDPDLLKLRNRDKGYGTLVCKHCGRTIDVHSMRCPKCGKEP